MERTSIVEKAIRNFKEIRRDRYEAVAMGSQPKDVAPKRNIVCSLVTQDMIQGGTRNEVGSKQFMDEFDQFVLHGDMQKKLKEVIGQSGAISEDCHNLDNNQERQLDDSVASLIHKDQQYENATEECEENQQLEFHDAFDTQNVLRNSSAINQDGSESSSDVEATEESSSKSSAHQEEYMFPSPEEIKNACAPTVGMVFATLQEAVRFVNVYGQLCGFAVIKGRNYKQRKISLNCNKARKTLSSVTGIRKRRRSTIDRTGCGMNVTVKTVDGKWHIISCNLEHNHDLVPSPSLTKFFLSHQTMTEEERMLSSLLQEIRVKPRGIMTVFRKLRGSFGNIMFSTKKLDNMKQGVRKQKKNSDIEFVLKYIEKIQLDKPGFCYKMEVDGEGAVRSIFWTDARSRLDYKMYGDIISFDTTYSTNRYNMPFAPIIGINGHGRTIVFGWALLKNEKGDTFKWLFESFVEVMQGKKPSLVLTDQDVAMKNAISSVFPLAAHRWCIFHVLRKMREHLSALMATLEGMEEEIMRLIMQSLTVEEFETGWKQMEETFGCGKHDHIMRMWKNRGMYVSAYFRGEFCPFIRSTGRSESFNSNFKDYVKRKDTIETFLKQYEIFQENIVHIENQDRFESSQKIPTYWCHQPIERHAGKIYNEGIYLKFVTELLNSTAFQVIEVEKDKEYKLKKMFRYENPEYWRDEFTVYVNRTSMEFACECGKFERDGVLCCHILRLFTQFDVMKIPDHYILRRWTSDYREKELIKHKKECVDMYGDNSSEHALRYAMMMNSVSDLCSDISRNQTKSKEFIEEVHKLHERLMGDGATQNNDGNVPVKLKDPPVIKKTTKKDNDSAQSSKNAEHASAPPKDNVSPEKFFSIDNFNSAGISNAKIPDQLGGRNFDLSAVGMARSFRPVQPVGMNLSIVSDAKRSSNLKNPPVTNNASVVKGNRLKPQSEKKANKKKRSKKMDSLTEGPPS